MARENFVNSRVLDCGQYTLSGQTGKALERGSEKCLVKSSMGKLHNVCLSCIVVVPNSEPYLSVVLQSNAESVGGCAIFSNTS